MPETHIKFSCHSEQVTYPKTKLKNGSSEKKDSKMYKVKHHLSISFERRHSSQLSSISSACRWYELGWTRYRASSPHCRRLSAGTSYFDVIVADCRTLSDHFPSIDCWFVCLVCIRASLEDIHPSHQTGVDSMDMVWSRSTSARRKRSCSEGWISSDFARLHAKRTNQQSVEQGKWSESVR